MQTIGHGSAQAAPMTIAFAHPACQYVTVPGFFAGPMVGITHSIHIVSLPVVVDILKLLVVPISRITNDTMHALRTFV